MAAGLALWDWTYPTQLPHLLQGERLFVFYRQQLLWFTSGGVAGVFLLWLLGQGGSSLPATAQRPARFWANIYYRPKSALIGAFAPLLFMPLIALRYWWHPLGLTYGSSFWAYTLVPPLAVALAGGFEPFLTRYFSPDRPFFRQIQPVHVVWGLIALYTVVFGALGITRHVSFGSHALNLGTMSQAVWNTSHGRFFEYTPLIEENTTDPVPVSNRLATGKLELIFLALAPFYRLWPDPVLLIITQTLALSLSAWPLFLALTGPCRRPAAGVEQTALLLTAAYLAYLPLHYINLANFHPNGLMPFFLAWALFALSRRHWRLYALALLGALICRSDAAFVALGLGLTLLIQKQTRVGILTALLGVAWLGVDFYLIVPWVETYYGPDTIELLNQRFGHYGDSPLKIILGLLRQPQMLAGTLLHRERMQTVFDLLMPLGGLSLAAPLWLLPAAPVTLVNLLANSAWQSSIRAHYFSAVPPFIFFAAGMAIYRIGNKYGSRWRGRLAVYVLACGLLTGFLLSPFPPGQQFHWRAFWNQSLHQAAIERVLAQVSPNSALSAQSDLLPHLTQRRELFIFPVGSSTAHEVLLDLDHAAQRAPLDYFSFFERVKQVIDNPAYGLAAWDNGVLLLRRGLPHQPDHLHALLRAYHEELHRVAWLSHTTPAHMKPHELYRVQVCFENNGSQGWHSQDQFPIFLAYHWLTDAGEVVVWDSERISLPFTLYPQQQVCLTTPLISPEQPGQYELQFDLVQEDQHWFSSRGSQPLRLAVTVSDPSL